MLKDSLRAIVALFGLLVAIVFGISTALAQVDTGAILGTVNDSSGAVIPGAKVTATDEGTGLTFSTTTSDVGSYVFTPLKIGTYTIAVEKEGFQKVIHSHIAVNVQAQVKVDVVLSPGAVTQSIEVTAAPPQLQTQNASIGEVATTRQILDLPLNGRNYTFLAQLGPGVTTINPSRGMDATGSFVANGLPTPLNNYILDGIDNNNDTVDFLNGAAYVNLPPPDAIQEFKVQTSDFSAEFGRAGGAVVNASIRTGTNQVHGDLWEFVRNDKLDAASWDQNKSGTQKGELRRNQFGGSIGGPVVIPHVYNGRNRTFFFGDYEGTRIAQSLFHNPTVPTAAEAASGFTNYQDLFGAGVPFRTVTDLLGRNFNSNTIFDPATTRAVSAGQMDPVTGVVATGSGYVRDPFYTCGSLAGMTAFTSATQEACLNMLPSTRLDSNAVKLLQLYPAANTAGIYGGTSNDYAINRSQPDNTNHFDVRMDQNFSERDTMFGRVSYSKRTAFFPGDFVGLASNAGFGAGNFSDMSFNSALSETHTFSPTLINELRFGYSRLVTSSNPVLVNQAGIPAQFGIQGVSQADGNYGLPDISIGGLTGLGAGAFASPNNRISDTTQLSENLTKVYGKHTFKGGFELQFLRFPWIDPAWSRGEMDFGGYTGIPNGVSGGVGQADLLLTPVAASVPNGVNNVGGPYEAFASNISGIDDIRHYYGTYFQDDWKVSPKLTVNLGLRWEFFGQVNEKFGANALFYPGGPTGTGAEYLINSASRNVPLSPSFTSLLATDNIPLDYSSTPGLIGTPLDNFAPRVGLAYQMNPKLVIRAAYGIFYGGFQNLGGAPDPGYNYPFAVNLSIFRQSDHQPMTFGNGQNATLETSLLNLNPNPASPNFSAEGLGLESYDVHWKTGYTEEWNFSAQYQLTPNDSLTLSYVGNGSHHQLNGDKRNVTTEILPPGTSCCTSYIPFPDFGYNLDFIAPDGDSFYYGLQATFERRFSTGLQGLVDYTYSRCMSDARNILGSFGDSWFTRAPLLPGEGLKADYHFCGSDVPDIFHASGIYQLPFGKGKHYGGGASGAVNQVIGGWSVQGILTMQNGFPFDIGCVQSTTANYGCVADLVAGQSVYQHSGPHSINQFLNPAAFAEPAVATAIGQSDYGPLGGRPFQAHGPSFDDLDFSLFKEFRTSERTHLEFRSEFFNFLNHPSFNNPSIASSTSSPAASSILNSTRGIPREVQLALKLYW